MTYWLNVYEDKAGQWIGGEHVSLCTAQIASDAVHNGGAGSRTVYRIKVRLKRTAA